MNESMKKAKEIVETSGNVGECIKKLHEAKLIVSFAEGRRLWDMKRTKPSASSLKLENK